MANVVIGGGPAGVRAAAAVGGLLLEPDGQAGGVLHPELAEDRGIAGARHAQVVDEAYGGAPSLQLSSGLLIRGSLRRLPIDRRELPAMLGGKSALALRDWSRTRARRAVRSLLGGGHEERSYRDWVVHRHGEAAYRLLFSEWAHRRFGAPEKAAVSLAHLHHSVPAEASVGLGRSPAEGWAHLVERIAELRTWVGVEAIEVQDGRAVRVRTDEWTIDLDGPLLCAAPPSHMAEWLDGMVDAELLRDLRALRTRHRLAVGLRASVDLPDEVHVIDDAPFFRVSRMAALGGEAGLYVAHIACDDGDPLWSAGDERVLGQVADAFSALGLGEAEPAGLQRLSDYDPMWTIDPWHPRHIRISRALSKLGIHLVGRSAAFRWADAGQELAFATALGQDPDAWHELQRTVLDPPVHPDETGVSITRFAER